MLFMYYNAISYNHKTPWAQSSYRTVATHYSHNISLIFKSKLKQLLITIPFPLRNQFLFLILEGKKRVLVLRVHFNFFYSSSSSIVL